MKENEAIEEIKKKICGERPTQHICSDGCMKGNDKCALSVAIKALEEVQQYRAIGTVEECRSAMDKQTARKATTNHSWTHYHFFCPVCNMEVNDMKYCPNCGQKLDWSDEQ